MKMKSRLASLLGFSFWMLSRSVQAQEPVGSQLGAGLQNPDPAMRAWAMEALVKTNIKASIRPSDKSRADRVGNEVLPLLIRGLTDPDDRVRIAASDGLAMIAAATKRVQYPPRPDLPDITSGASAREALLQASSNSSEAVRLGAIRAFPTDPRVEQSWISQFQTEQSEEVKKLLLDAILVGQSYSPEAVNFVVSQLQDERYAYEAAKAIVLEMKVPPLEALPLIASGLGQSPDPGKRDLFARALSSYGERARPYLSEVENMLGRETDPTVKENLRNAIRRITDSKGGMVQAGGSESPPAASHIATIGRSPDHDPVPLLSPMSSPSSRNGSNGPFPIRWIVAVAVILLFVAGTVWLLPRGQSR